MDDRRAIRLLRHLPSWISYPSLTAEVDLKTAAAAAARSMEELIALRAKLARVQALPAKWKVCQQRECPHHDCAFDLKVALKDTP